ncbi:MAG: CRISPR-associated endoribonuclease Cas6 [Candidatus Atribacteria bacterium]|nr:CRISPR-associated endoribonuclease Cas6 [Candidatus Atribacteria bacterium]
MNLQSQHSIFLPIHHNTHLQGFIYSNLNNSLADMLHNQGYQLGQRNFKLFTFSRLMGKMNFNPEKGFTFYPPVSLIIASPKVDILESLAHYLIKKKGSLLGKNTVWAESIEVMVDKKFTSEVKIIMLSPIVMYSTLYRPDGKKKTYYYNPWEKEFSEKLKDNLLKKLTLISSDTNPSQDYQFQITPLLVNKNHEKIIFYKQTVIHGWMGQYQVSGSPELIRVAYSAGLGCKNSAGFGCFEIQ